VDTWKDLIGRVSTLAGVDLSEDFDAGKREHPKPRDDQAELAKERQAAARAGPTLAERRKTLKKNSPELAKRRRQKDTRYLEKLKRKLKAQGWEDIRPAVIPAHDWIRSAQVVSDATGTAARYYLDSQPNRVAMGLLLDLIGGREALTGISASATRARKILALLLLILSNARPTRRNWDRYKSLCKGIPQSAMLKALQDPYSRRPPHLNTLIGTHRARPQAAPGQPKPRDTRTSAEVGYLRALANARIIYARQARWQGTAKPKTRGWENIQENEIRPKPTESGWRVSTNRYWIVTDRFSDPHRDEEKAALFSASEAARRPQEARPPKSTEDQAELAQADARPGRPPRPPD
jgi:hypothetical protein